MKSHILLVIGGLFALTVIGRGVTLNAANAANNDAEKNAGQSAAAAAAAEPVSADEMEACVTGPILESFKQRRLAVETREQELAERERTLEAVEKRIEERMAALDASNQQLADKMALLQRTASADITHLTTMYASMKPQEASDIFNKMDSVFAAGFLREMRSEQAGLILANMNPDKAYEISIIIANKNSEFRPKVQ